MRFLLVDRVEEIERGKFARGIKNIALSEDVFQDHFPENPVFPGTLVVESMAQLGGFLAECTVNTADDNIRRAVLVQIVKAKFHEPSLPGEQLELKCEWLSMLADAVQINAEARICGKLAARATLMFVLRAIDSEKVHQQRKEIYQIWTRRLKLDFQIR